MVHIKDPSLLSRKRSPWSEAVGFLSRWLFFFSSSLNKTFPISLYVTVKKGAAEHSGWSNLLLHDWFEINNNIEREFFFI